MRIIDGPAAQINPAIAPVSLADLQDDYQIGYDAALEGEGDAGALDAPEISPERRAARWDGWRDGRERLIDRTRAWVDEMNGGWDHATNGGCW